MTDKQYYEKLQKELKNPKTQEKAIAEMAKFVRDRIRKV